MRGWRWWWVNILDHCPVSCCVPEPSGDGTWVLDVVPYGGLKVVKLSFFQYRALYA